MPSGSALRMPRAATPAFPIDESATRTAFVRIVRNAFGFIEGGDMDQLEAILHPHIVYRRPGWPVIVGRDAVMTFYRESRSALTSRILLDDIIVDGSAVVAMGMVEGRARDGAPIHERFADAFRFEDDLIRDRTTYFFRAGF